MKPYKAIHHPDCKPRMILNPFIGGHTTTEEGTLPEENNNNSVMNSYFRHMPQLIQQNQMSMRVKKTEKNELTPGSVTARPKTRALKS